MSDPLAAQLFDSLGVAARRIGRLEPEDPLQLARELGIDGYIAAHVEGIVEIPGLRLYRRLRTMTLLEAAAEVHETLARARVPHFFYKGIALFGTAYEPGDRDVEDIDLHVHLDARRRAQSELRKLGYREAADREQPGPQALRAALMLVRGDSDNEVESISLDLHWAIEPLDRLLPRSDQPMPDTVWESLNETSSLPSPSPEHHLALLAHHLVHHDLLHVKGILDFALVWRAISGSHGAEWLNFARTIGALRATQALSGFVQRELQLPARPNGANDRSLGSGRLAGFDLPSLLAMAANASEAQHVMITPARIRRRLGFIDRPTGLWNLMADAVVPPRAYLHWRWPESKSALHGWYRHVRRVVSKAWNVDGDA